MAGRQCSVDGCTNAARSRNWCGTHYARWLRHGDVNHLGRVIYGSAEERFWPKVDRDVCWVWTAAKNEDGYGLFFNGSRNMGAHKWAYENRFGPVSSGLELDHLCRNRACVNPDHLEPVSSLENTRRSPTHYGSRTHCKHGHEYTPENTISRKDGGRRCRTCKADYRRRTRNRPAQL